MAVITDVYNACRLPRRCRVNIDNAYIAGRGPDISPACLIQHTAVNDVECVLIGRIRNKIIICPGTDLQHAYPCSGFIRNTAVSAVVGNRRAMGYISTIGIPWIQNTAPCRRGYPVRAVPLTLCSRCCPVVCPKCICNQTNYYQ